MKNLLIATLFVASLYAENNNSTLEHNISSENNVSSVSIETNFTVKEDKVQKQLQKQIEREKKFAKEQTFYQGADHNLSYAEINPDAIDSVPLIEPDYDFNMDDVYD